MSTSIIELNSEAIRTNMDFIESLLKSDCIVSYVVKGNAYGHGIEEYVPEILAHGAKHFSVFSGGEAKRVKKIIQNKADLLVLGHLFDEELEWCIDEEIEFYVFDSIRLQKAISYAEKRGKKAKIHLELETGMNRAGFEKKDLIKIIPTLIKEKINLDIIGICTHFAGAESITNYHRVKKQISNFKKMKDFLKAQSIEAKIYHTACSAAMIRYPSTQMDMVRVGILQYGFWPSNETFIDYLGKKKNPISPLKRVLEWKSSIMNIKRVKSGSFIGYGTSFLAEQDMIIAAIPVGYAYGFDRDLSNLGKVLLAGYQSKVVGLVNMNMIIVDITSIPDVYIGDEAVLIGKQGENEITVASFAQLRNQLNYELLTRLPHDIERKIIK
jgi:alanine racemase